MVVPVLAASGKSSVAGLIMKQYGIPHIDAGAHVHSWPTEADCVWPTDKLGHLAYAPGTDCNQSLVEEFGSQIRDQQTGEIIR